MRIEKKQNGLYQAKLALDEIDTTNSTLQTVSGILQGNINTATGNISSVSGNLNTVSGNVNKLLSYARSNYYSRVSLHGNPILTTNVVDNRQLIPFSNIDARGNFNNTVFICLVSFSINVSSGSPIVRFFTGFTTDVASHAGISGGTYTSNFQNGLLYTKLFLIDEQSANTLYFSTDVTVGSISNYNLYTFQVYALALPPESAY